ncbi:MAG: response regulator transcription factor [Candidatus Berkelbacteria bacterium]|nr:response regulator transcription factor [Candidatus Berkelbacteria bacterium]
MRILIIEDDHKIANAIKKGFEQESYAVDVSYDGADGVGMALTINYDLIILDRMLPGTTDGIKICQAIRKEGRHTPVLILTAKDNIKDRVEGLNAGADDYLTKPFAFEELLARVKALLRRPNKNLGTSLQVGDLTLDTITYKVTRASKDIPLSQTEFRILEYLMRNPNRILTKNSIIEHVWDYDADILPNTVEAYIGYLRNKIDRLFKNKPQLIHTVRGFGYKISES